ncbi:MAG TPA: hypothetical protein VMT20_02735 [Terriglobia bacterium]|nr:hypothetical protein [Terriglobia bacterium]
MDYEKAKQDAFAEKDALQKRREEIDQETARLKHERAVTERRLVGLKQVLDGLTIMTTEPVPTPVTPEPVVVTPPPTFIQEPPPRKTLPFPISFVAGLVVKKERKDSPAPQLQPTGANGAIVVKTEWEGAPPPLPRVEPRQEKREWLG